MTASRNRRPLTPRQEQIRRARQRNAPPELTLPPTRMVLHTVFVTFNRLDLTQQSVESYLATVTVPHTYLVVDNMSTDGTREWLAEQGHPTLLLPANRYPGFATNRGWEHTPPEATYLQRADNDFAFKPGWCDVVEERFRESSRFGQVGLRTDSEENYAPMNVGGCNIIRRELFDQGLRYDERPWTRMAAGMSEDSYFSPLVLRLGYLWTRVQKPCLVWLATGDWNDPYHVKSHADRGMYNPANPRSIRERRPRR